MEANCLEGMLVQTDKQVAIEVENVESEEEDYRYFDGFEIILVLFVLINKNYEIDFIFDLLSGFLLSIASFSTV